MPIASFIRYFRDCYRADQREANIWNVLDTGTEQLRFFPGEEKLLNAELPHFYLDQEYAETLLGVLQLFQGEKSLFYFSFFVTGIRQIEGQKARALCAPLLYYPAEIIQDKESNYFFNIDIQNVQVNYPLLSLLDNIPEESYETALFKALPGGALDYPQLQKLIKALSPYLTGVNFEEAYRFPEDMLSEADLKKEIRKKGLKLLPASALGILSHSRNTRGVLNELSQMGEGTVFSPAIQDLFFPTSSHSDEINDSVRVPTTLSAAQEKLIKQTRRHSLNLVIGPPGTGKSFSIAALAIDQMNRGNSVLIASRNNEAVDVIMDKLAQQLGGDEHLVRGGKSAYQQNFKNYLEGILKGISGVRNSEIMGIINKIPLLEKEVEKLEKQVQEFEKIFREKVKQEQDWANYIFEKRGRKFLIAKWIYQYRSRRILRKSKNQHPLWEIQSLWQNALKARNETLKALLLLQRQKQIWKSAGSHRPELRKFLKALKVRRNVQQEALFAQTNFEVILRIFPIWLVNLADVSELLPLSPAMFDLAIIDESSQCDIASTLPIFQRAKKIVIVGDDQQLRHVSFLSRKRQEQLQIDNGLLKYDQPWLDYRDNSILDMVNEQIPKQEQVTFLDEHYRSLPEIIQFSNQHFYRNALHIMQQRPGNKRAQGLQLLRLEGKRDPKGHNEIEARAILEQIQEIIREQKSNQTEKPLSIGVLSPFRDQVDYLSQLIQEAIPLNLLEKHQILLGTAHSFQGNERDVMLLSLVLDDDSSSGSFRFLNQRDVFNVSITRARLRQYVFCSLSSGAFPMDSLLGKYLAYLEQPEGLPMNPPHLLNSIPYEFAEEVKNQLIRKGWQVNLAYPVAGLKIDLLLSAQHKFLGLDLIAYEGIYGHMISLERYKMLHRTGLKIFPLPYTLWKQDAAYCLGEIEKALFN